MGLRNGHDGLAIWTRLRTGEKIDEGILDNAPQAITPFWMVILYCSPERYSGRHSGNQWYPWRDLGR